MESTIIHSTLGVEIYHLYLKNLFINIFIMCKHKMDSPINYIPVMKQTWKILLMLSKSVCNVSWKIYFGKACHRLHMWSVYCN